MSNVTTKEVEVNFLGMRARKLVPLDWADQLVIDAFAQGDKAPEILIEALHRVAKEGAPNA